MKTLVLGASTNPSRYSYKAIKSLIRHNAEVIAVGKNPGEVDGVSIDTELKNVDNIHTILLYLNANNQKAYYKQLLDLNPKRIIFNPGAENPEFELMAKNNQIEVLNTCGIVMINTDNF